MEGNSADTAVKKSNENSKPDTNDQPGDASHLNKLDPTARKPSAGRESTLPKASVRKSIEPLPKLDSKQVISEEETDGEDEEDEGEYEGEIESVEEEEEVEEVESVAATELTELEPPSEPETASDHPDLDQCQVIVGKAKERHDLVDEYLRLKAELKYEEKKNAYLQDRIYKTSVRKGIIDEAKLKREEAKHKRKTDNIRLILRRKLLVIRALKREQRRRQRRMEGVRGRRGRKKSGRESKWRKSDYHRHTKHSATSRQSVTGDPANEAGEGGDEKKHCKHRRETATKSHRHSWHSHAQRESTAEDGHKKGHKHRHTHHHKEKGPKESGAGKKEENKKSQTVPALGVSKNVPKTMKVKHLQRLRRSKSLETSVLTEQERRNKEFDFGKANPLFVIKGRGRLLDRINNEFKYDWLVRQVIIHLRKEKKYAFYHENNLRRQACKRDLWKKAHEQKLQEILYVLRLYSEEAVDSNTGYRIPRSSTEQFCKDIQAIHTKLCDTMVSMFKSRRGLELSLKRLEASEVQGEGLQMLEYEQLRSENQTLKDRLGDRVKDVDNIKDKITHAIQVLAHFRNKMFSMNQLIREGKEELNKVNNEVYDARGRTEAIVRRHEYVKREEQALVVESGLLDNTTLLRDYERTHFHVLDLKMEKKRLTTELDGYTQEINEIKKRIGELQANYPDIFAKQQEVIAAKQAERKRQRIEKYNKATEHCLP